MIRMLIVGYSMGMRPDDSATLSGLLKLGAGRLG